MITSLNFTTDNLKANNGHTGKQTVACQFEENIH